MNLKLPRPNHQCDSRQWSSHMPSSHYLTQPSHAFRSLLDNSTLRHFCAQGTGKAPSFATGFHILRTTVKCLNALQNWPITIKCLTSTGSSWPMQPQVMHTMTKGSCLHSLFGQNFQLWLATLHLWA